MTGPLPGPEDRPMDRPPGPNQWFKDQLDTLIDAEFMTDCQVAALDREARWPWLRFGRGRRNAHDAS